MKKLSFEVGTNHELMNNINKNLQRLMVPKSLNQGNHKIKLKSWVFSKLFSAMDNKFDWWKSTYKEVWKEVH